MKRSVRHDRTSYNKEMLLKPKVINCNQWKSMIHTFLQKVFVTGTFRYTDAVVYYTGFNYRWSQFPSLLAPFCICCGSGVNFSYDFVYVFVICNSESVPIKVTPHFYIIPCIMDDVFSSGTNNKCFCDMSRTRPSFHSLAFGYLYLYN